MSSAFTLGTSAVLAMDVATENAKNLQRNQSFHVQKNTTVLPGASLVEDITHTIVIPKMDAGWLMKMKSIKHTCVLDSSGGTPLNPIIYSSVFRNTNPSNVVGDLLEGDQERQIIGEHKFQTNADYGPVDILSSDLGYILPGNTFNLRMYNSATSPAGVTTSLRNHLDIEYQFIFDQDLYTLLVNTKALGV